MIAHRCWFWLAISAACLAGCDWMHATDFRVTNFVEDDRPRLESALAEIAADFSMEPLDPCDFQGELFSIYRENYRTTQQSIWIRGHEQDGTAIIRLSAFNRGGPFSPPDRYNRLKQRIRNDLKHVFPSRVQLDGD